MPFLIQFVANANTKLEEIDERTKPKEEEAADGQGMDAQNMMMNPGMLALPDQGMGMMPPMGQMPGQGMPGPPQMGMGMPPQMGGGQMNMQMNMGNMGTMNNGGF